MSDTGVERPGSPVGYRRSRRRTGTAPWHALADGRAALIQENTMQSSFQPRLAQAEIDDGVDDGDFDTTVHLDVETGRIIFHAAWAVAADAPPVSTHHSVVLTLDCSTMARYADLDDGARRRVHAMLHETVQQKLERLPEGQAQTLSVELSDAMLDAARRLQ